VLRSLQAMLGDRRAVNELERLSDHQLRDIGVDRRQVAELVKRESTRDFLIESGWPPSRRAQRS
jgi:uncharacterized protein YjiS (DUF1127 family)